MGNKVKLIIWDLDDTLWDGSIMVSKDVKLRHKYIDLIKDLNTRGVISSVCSNNYFDFTKDILIDMGIWDLFIMPNINYESKALRIKSMIEDFQLRPENVYFIDDNEFNLNEVKHYIPNINLIDGKDDNSITELLESTKNDNEIDGGKRFERYKIIEEKVTLRENYGTNEEFLIDSNIIVDYKKATENDIDRVYELVHRTNQLNYTKNRKDKSELLKDIKNNDSFIIKVSDKYGYYGEVGFVSFNKKYTDHFSFSCRILNMGVVDYIYNHFNLPKFEIKGDVAVELSNKTPTWVSKGKVKVQNDSKTSLKMLMIGGCDLGQLKPYISKKYNVSTYFNYNHKNIPIHRDSIDFLTSPNFDDITKKYILDTVPFVTEKSYEKPNIKGHDIIVYSALKDYGQGKYVSDRIPNYYMSCHPFFHTNWNDSDLKKFSNERGIGIDKLRKFSNEWKPVEKPIDVFRKQLLTFITELTNEAKKVFIILGAENYYPDFDKDVFKPGERYKKFNDLIRDIVKDFNNVVLISPSDYIKNREDFTNNVRHYTRPIYKMMGDKINDNLKNV